MVLRPMIGRQLDNMDEMENYILKEGSDLDYTIVRPPRLLDAPLLGWTMFNSDIFLLGFILMIFFSNFS
jgi:hypothetical protein